MAKAREQVEMAVTVGELSGLDKACAAVRGFRSGTVALEEVSAALVPMTAQQLEVIAFCTRANINQLRAVRDAGKP